MTPRRTARRFRTGTGVRRAVGLVTVLTLLVVAVASFALLRTTGELQDVQDSRVDQTVPARVNTARLLSSFVDQETAERGFVLTADEDYLAPYENAAREIDPLLDEISRRTTEIPGVAARLDALRTAHANWVARVAEPEIRAVRAGDRERAVELVASGSGRLLFEEVRRAHADADALIAAAELRAGERMTALTTRLTVLLAATLLMLALLAVLAALTVERLIAVPLRRIGESARLVADGDLEHPVRGGGPREFRALAEDVDAMRNRLLDEIAAAEHATEALALREPTVGALQVALAPRLRSVDGIEIGARLEPAEGVLAGDFVDSIDLGEGRLGFVLGDVAGHGPGPAIFGLRLKQLLGALLAAGLTPGQALSTALTRLDDVNDETFATVVVGIVDRPAGEIRYANAGHPPPLVLGAAFRGHPIELAATGPFLSPLFPQARWETRCVRFAVDNLLLAYTDGVTEARDAAGRELGLGRPLASLAEQDPREELDRVLDVLYGDIRDHAVALKDDTTLLLCRFADQTDADQARADQAGADQGGGPDAA